MTEAQAKELILKHFPLLKEEKAINRLVKMILDGYGDYIQ